MSMSATSLTASRTGKKSESEQLPLLRPRILMRRAASARRFGRWASQGGDQNRPPWTDGGPRPVHTPILRRKVLHRRIVLSSTVAPGCSRPCPAARCRGGRPRAGSSAPLRGLRPVVGGLHVVAHEREELGQAVDHVDVVVDDENARRTTARLPTPVPVTTVDRWPALPRAVEPRIRSPCRCPSLFAVTLPPCASTSFLTTVRPMPSPPSERASVRSPWAKSSNISGSLSGGMPTPVSLTVMTISPSSWPAESQIWPPVFGVFRGVVSAGLSPPVPAASGRR